MLADDQFHLETSLIVTGITPDTEQFYVVVAANGRGHRTRRINVISNGTFSIVDNLLRETHKKERPKSNLIAHD